MALLAYLDGTAIYTTRLPREAVGAPSLRVLKARLDGALGSLSCWVVLPMAGFGTGQALRTLSAQAIL